MDAGAIAVYVMVVIARASWRISSLVSIQRNARNGRNARIDTASIFASAASVAFVACFSCVRCVGWKPGFISVGDSTCSSLTVGRG